MTSYEQGVAHRPTSSSYDYNPSEAKRLLAGIGFKDANGDGFLEDARGNPVELHAEDQQQTTRCASAWRTSSATIWPKIGIKMTLTPIDFNTLITNLTTDFQYDAILLGFQSSVPPTPFGGQNVWRSSGESHFWFIRQQKPATPEEARIDRAPRRDADHAGPCRCRRARGRRCRHIMNEQGWFIWLPILDDQAAGQQPVRQRAAERHGASHALEHRPGVREAAARADTPPCAPTCCGGCCRRSRCCSASR